LISVSLVGVASGHFDALRPLGGFMQMSVPASRPTQASARFESIRSNAELDRALADARGRPMMIDFYADWCITCKELERFTFSDSVSDSARPFPDADFAGA
jgi:thioredoxin:protein disulfide reductase